MPHHMQRRRFLCRHRRRANLWWACILALTAIVTASCSGLPTTPGADDSEQSYLEFDVVPATAEIYIDDDYRGVIEGWREQVIPIEEGHRRLELRAHGYMTQRFDLDVGPGEWLVLRVRMEPTIGGPDGEDDQQPPEIQDPLQPPVHPTSPDDL